MDQQAERLQESFRAQRLFDHGRQIQREATVLTATVEEAAAEVTAFLREQTQRHLYRTLATAAGVGYVIGGGLASRLTKVLLGLGGRLTVAIVARELGGLLQGGDRKVVVRAPRAK